MPQSGPADYRGEIREPQSDQHDGIMEQAGSAARDMGESAGTLAGELAIAVKERPYATVAIAAGLAFAVGALWKLGRREPITRIDRLRAQLPEIPSGRELQHFLQSKDLREWLPRGWR
jgi:hypothetical protein